MTYKSFDDWYHQEEGLTGTRSMRFAEDVDAKSVRTMEEWLRTAWKLGAESADVIQLIRKLIDGYTNSSLGGNLPPDVREAFVAELKWLLLATEKILQKRVEISTNVP